MFVLKLIFLFNLSKIILSLNNTLNNNYPNSLPIIQNTPVENNIPLIIQEINKNNLINNKNPIILPNIQKQKEIITSTDIKINTSNMDPMCTKECCMGCQVQFNKLTSQKNCIINICKCQIISINNIEINNTNNNTSNNLFEKEKVIILIGSMNNIMDNDKINIENNSPYFFYWFLMFVFICYESYILYNLNIKDNKFIIIRNNNNENLDLEKDKEKRINDYMELLYGDEELIECLI